MKQLFAFFSGVIASVFSIVVMAEIEIRDVKVKEPIPGQTVIAGYLLLKNSGDEARILKAVSTNAAETVEMHTHVREHHDHHHHETMRMEKIDFVEVPANSEFTFEPGGHHLMLFSPKDEFIGSGEIELTFTFENGETMTAMATIESWK